MLERSWSELCVYHVTRLRKRGEEGKTRRMRRVSVDGERGIRTVLDGERGIRTVLDGERGEQLQ